MGSVSRRTTLNAIAAPSQVSPKHANPAIAAVIAPIVPSSASLQASNLVDVASTETSVDVSSPTTTVATGTVPDTSGVLSTSLETAGNPSVQPFPTSIPSSVTSTIQPSSSILPLSNATSTNPSSISSPLVVPTATITAVLSKTVTTTVPVETVISGHTVTSFQETETVITSAATRVLNTTLPAGTISHAVPTPLATCYDNSGCTGQDIFEPVGLGPVPDNIPTRDDHPQPRLGINQTTPIETNKFYANAFLGSQGQSIFSEPYTLQWSKGSGNAMSYGMSISHIDSDQKVYGPVTNTTPGDPVAYYINPIGIQSVILSAAEIGSSSVMTTDSLEQFSANINLLPQAGSNSGMTFPVASGMGFVTALYTDLTPAIQSSVFFDHIEGSFNVKSGIWKYRLYLADQKQWLMYVMPSDGVTDPQITMSSATLITGRSGFSGTIQIAKNPGASTQNEAIFDASSGAYPLAGHVQGYASGSSGSYAFGWDKGGPYAANTSLLMFALPHHVESFDTATKNAATAVILDTTTKGDATAVMADTWTLLEPDLPVTMGFAPWANGTSATTLSSAAIAAIQPIAASEVSQNMSQQSDLDSMYYSGKALSKFAQLVYTMNDLADQKGLATAGLATLKDAFARFVNNQQDFPLVYDSAWKGAVSSASYVTGDSGVDFGNSYYNDHHFHYGYFLHAAAVIGYLDPSWLADNQAWVNMLVRDVSNPSSQDTYFPVFRSFDWYNGHSWAKGLFESGDGKDEESSSEDTMFAYGLKMWGRTRGDASMEARGNMMLAVLARSLNNYFLLKSDNANQPAPFVPNKNTGIVSNTWLELGVGGFGLG
ncbi:MAG: hypothetical protein Q9227_002555 [Pyrenula ochraceoflavens]